MGARTSKARQVLRQASTITWLVAAVYFLTAYTSLALTQGTEGIASVWPASGVLVAALLLTRANQMVSLLSAVAVASFAANVFFGTPPLVALAYTIANLIEGVVIAQLVLRFSSAPRRLDNVHWLSTFFAATIVGSLVSASIATGLSGSMAIQFFVSWFTTVCLGALIVTPLILMIVGSDQAETQHTGSRATINLLLVTGCIAVVSGLTFAFGDTRMLFLPVIGVVTAAYICGPRGAAVNICLITALVALNGGVGEGTYTLWGVNTGAMFEQFYLFCLILAAWPLAALATEKAQLIDQYARANKFLKMAESTAQVGHWHIGADNSSLVWSDEVHRIHGVQNGDYQLVDPVDLKDKNSLKFYHPADRERIRTILLSSMEQQAGFEYRARIIRPDGSIRHVSSFGHPQFDAAGEFEGLFGTFQDITEQTDILSALQEARQEAVREAKAARRLAATDELTGIASRRSILAKLREASEVAEQGDEHLTIAILDIDFFKNVNDRHGHHVGDQVIRHVTDIASELLRPTDSIGRLGGEEFLVILPGVDEPSGYEIVERIRLRIAAEDWSKFVADPITISAGLATIRDHHKIEAALKRADDALYKAKHGGRNTLRAAA